jgi:hypothetical protein
MGLFGHRLHHLARTTRDQDWGDTFAFGTRSSSCVKDAAAFAQILLRRDSMHLLRERVRLVSPSPMKPQQKLTYAERRARFLENIESGFTHASDLLDRLERQRMEHALFLEFNAPPDLLASPSANANKMLDAASDHRIRRLAGLLCKSQSRAVGDN